MICVGLDAGSRAIKVVLLDGDSGDVLAADAINQGVRQEELAVGLLDRALTEQNLRRENVARIVATGYGRDGIGLADETITEITCHARGVRHVAPTARTIIEIGGQDSKFIQLDETGLVHDFAMNDRCAAGTGRFLELIADRLELPLDQLGASAAAATAPAAISSMCVVFAETEIIGLLARGVEPSDIVAGVQRAVAARVSAMAGRNIAAPIVLTGGVAMIGGMAAAISHTTGLDVSVAPMPQMTGALGAALFACQHAS